METMTATFNNKEYKCIQKEKTLYLLFDSIDCIPRGNGWCVVDYNDSLKEKHYIKRSKDNSSLFNNNCVIYDIYFSCRLNPFFDGYVIKFYSELFNKLFTRFKKKPHFKITINSKGYDVIIEKKRNKTIGDFGILLFECEKIVEEDLMHLYNYVSSLMRFISLDTCVYPNAFFVNDCECFCANNKNYDWMEVDFIPINELKMKDIERLFKYIADNGQLLSNLYFSNQDFVSTKDVGSLYSIIDNTLDNCNSRKYNKRVSNKQSSIKHKKIVSLINKFGRDNDLFGQNDFDSFYGKINEYGLSIKEKLQFVLDDYIEAFEADEGMSLNNEDLINFAKSVNKIRSFDAHGDNIQNKMLAIGLSYSEFLQELAYYTIFRFSLNITRNTIKSTFSNCYPFVSVNSGVWIRNKIKK